MSYIISYDVPRIYTQWNRPVIIYGSVEKALLALGGKVDPLGPKTTIRYRPASGVSMGKVKAAVRKALDPFEGSAVIIERKRGFCWTWPSTKYHSVLARPYAKWMERRL